MGECMVSQTTLVTGYPLVSSRQARERVTAPLASINQRVSITHLNYLFKTSTYPQNENLTAQASKRWHPDSGDNRETMAVGVLGRARDQELCRVICM
jgi:hypothetical protein